MVIILVIDGATQNAILKNHKINEIKPETFTLNWKYDKKFSKDQINWQFEFNIYIL